MEIFYFFYFLEICNSKEFSPTLKIDLGLNDLDKNPLKDKKKVPVTQGNISLNMIYFSQDDLE